jgi:DNA-directed RNA polymerase subunit RPC12/RpoP
MAQTREVTCPACKAAVAMRVNRSGFMQRHVLGHLGFFPWKCGACGSMFLFRRRGFRTRSHRAESDAAGHSGGSHV